MENKLDAAFARDGDLEYPLSLEPNLIINPAVKQNIHFNYGETVNPIRSEGLPPYYFISPLVEISDSSDMPQNPDGSYAAAYISIAPISHEEKAYFPYIRLSVNPQNPSEDDLNWSFRHELAHYINQDTSPPPYSRARFGNAIRSIGMGALSYGALAAGFNPSLFNVVAAATCTGIGATLIEKPHYIGHRMVPRELRADYFAWRHREFNPLSIIE